MKAVVEDVEEAEAEAVAEVNAMDERAEAKAVPLSGCSPARG